jgi:hypothetical protein
VERVVHGGAARRMRRRPAAGVGPSTSASASTDGEFYKFNQNPKKILK